jgi:hypothetical protein
MSEIEDFYDEREHHAEGRASQPTRSNRRVANPDDWPVHPPPRGPRGPLPGPREHGPGRVAIAQGQVFIVGAILIAQLWLVTDALYELLSGRTGTLGWLALASGVGFVIALAVWLWPYRHIGGL